MQNLKTWIRSLRILTAALPLCAAVAVPNASAEDKLVMDGSTTVGPVAKAFAEYYMSINKDVNVVVSESGSGNGAKSLMNGTCDIANMSRAMKSGEFKAAADNGVQPYAHVVALDGLAVVVHPSNPVRGLKLSQIRDIYLGKITNWREVGGANQPIVMITRDTNSGTFETFENLVMAKAKISTAAETAGSNGAIRQRVSTTPNAIGYVGLGFVDNSLKPVEVDGVYPEQGTIASGKYPIARPLFMYTNGYPKLGSHVYSFVTLHLTEKGQEIIESIGFIPVTNY